MVLKVINMAKEDLMLVDSRHYKKSPKGVSSELHLHYITIKLPNTEDKGFALETAMKENPRLTESTCKGQSCSH